MPKELRHPDNALAAVCLCVGSQSSSVAPEWDSRNPDSVRRSLLEHAGRCIRRGRLLAVVPWEWVRLGLYLRRLRPAVVHQDARVPRHAVQGSATFRVG